VAALTVTAAGADGPARIGLTGLGVAGGPDRPSEPPGAAVDLQVPASLTVGYGSSVGTAGVTARPGTGVTLAATGVPEGVTFVDDGLGSGRFGGTALAVPGTSSVRVTATTGAARTSRTFDITVTPADLTIRWASPLLDVSPGSPAQVRAMASLPTGTSGDLTRAQVVFDVENVVSGERTQIGPFDVRPSGDVDLTLSPGQLPVGTYTARARLAPGNPYFRLAGAPPTAVLVNSDVVGAAIYVLSDILNLVKP